MHLLRAVAIVVLSAGVFAQSAPPACPADRPVDELIAELAKLQSKNKHRNSNPLPDSICILGWCRERSKKPPKSAPQAESPNTENAPPVENPGGEGQNPSGMSSNSTSASGTSSSKSPEKSCDDAMELALSAAHNVEVGDYYFEDQKYNPALLRYKDALTEKPGDAAIHVRLGRVLEKLKQVPEAIEHYKAAQSLSGPEKWTDEAKSALSRLGRPPG